MADVLLIHSALGLRPAVLADARRLRALGHRVVAPDLFKGEQFSDTGTALRHLDRVGRDVVRRRAQDVAAQMDPGVVYAGYSMGAGLAHSLLAVGGQVAGAILLSNANPPISAPYQLRVQVHVSQQDPWVDPAHLRLMTNAGAEVYTYDGGHLFTDPDLRDHNARSAALVWERVDAFLGQMPGATGRAQGSKTAATPPRPAKSGLSYGGEGDRRPGRASGTYRCC